jgi:hypothetical protein
MEKQQCTLCFWRAYVVANSLLHIENFSHGIATMCCLLLRYLCGCQQHETHLGLHVKLAIFCTILINLDILDSPQEKNFTLIQTVGDALTHAEREQAGGQA